MMSVVFCFVLFFFFECGIDRVSKGFFLVCKDEMDTAI
jgi:hypothetical protein